MIKEQRKINKAIAIIKCLMVGGFLFVSITISYLTALIGYPNSVWLWHTILGIL